jgi:hypothetical protein
MGRYREIDPTTVRTTPLLSRESLVSVDGFVRRDALRAGEDPLAAFPEILAGRDIRRLADRVVESTAANRAVVVMMGGHVIKTGVSPCLLELLERRVITALAGNGSVAVHDVEIALGGRTSERVDRGLTSGDFGVARETGDFLNSAASAGAARDEGFGESLGRMLVEEKAPYVRESLLAAAYRLGVPFTIHVTIGADIVHQLPSCDGSALGTVSLRDFRIFAHALRDLSNGVVLNVGSAVVMPEVFLKALNVVRNLGVDVRGFTSANLDFIQHYRPRRNVLDRPTGDDGEAIALTGHHELLIPIWTRAVLYRLEQGKISRTL